MITSDPNAASAVQATSAADAAGITSGKYSPRNLELRSLALHQLLTTRLREHPERLERIRETLAHWRVVVAPCSQHYVAAWQAAGQRGARSG